MNSLVPTEYSLFMVNKILANAPTDVRINFNFFPLAPPSKAARKLEAMEMISDVLCALNIWYYAEE